MARPLSPTSQQVLDLRKAKPEATAREIGELVGITGGAVAQTESRLREKGHLPKLRRSKYARSKRGKRTPTPASQPPSLDLSRAQAPAHASGNGNGGASVEELLGNELGDVLTRIEAIRHERERLDAELLERESRRERLEAAQQALNAEPEQPAAEPEPAQA